MFRFTASPRVYVKLLGDNLLDKLGISGSVKLLDAEDFFIIAKDDLPVVIKDYDFVEKKRQEGVHTFEEWLETEVAKQ